MVRRELIFFGTLISWLLFVFIGICFFPTFLKAIEWLPLFVIVILMGFITPRYFSKNGFIYHKETTEQEIIYNLYGKGKIPCILIKYYGHHRKVSDYNYCYKQEIVEKK